MISHIVLKKETEIQKRKQIHFLLCGSCFWCASCIELNEKVMKCPSCINNEVESIPISNDEIYTFGHDGIRGVTLTFTSSR